MDKGLIVIAVDGELEKIATEYGVKVVDIFDLADFEKKQRPTLFGSLPPTEPRSLRTT